MHTTDATLKRPLRASFERLRMTPDAIFVEKNCLPNNCGDNTSIGGRVRVQLIKYFAKPFPRREPEMSS